MIHDSPNSCENSSILSPIIASTFQNSENSPILSCNRLIHAQIVSVQFYKFYRFESTLCYSMLEMSLNVDDSRLEVLIFHVLIYARNFQVSSFRFNFSFGYTYISHFLDPRDSTFGYLPSFRPTENSILLGRLKTQRYFLKKLL